MNQEFSTSLQPFVVRESSTINYIFGFVFFALFIMAYLSVGSLKESSRSLEFISFGMLFPAIIFLAKAIKKRIVMQFDVSGFYYRGKLITTWQNFVSAYITALEQPGSLEDNFILVLEYYTPEKGIVYRVNLNMDKSQDKSDNEIMEAVKLFSDNVSI